MMESTLLRTKLLIPQVRPVLVEREHLITRLDEGLTRKLILVSAPAGYGKTTLLSAWAARCQLPVAWLSLEEGDNDPARFVAYFTAALGRVEASIGESFQEGSPSEKNAKIGSSRLSEELQIALLNKIYSMPVDFVLVLDDYHLISNQNIHRFIEFIVEHIPPQMHLVISGRADPSLPLARLRARSQITELRELDLRFTEEETAEFLERVMGVKLKTGDITVLARRTEGWAAGLQMAAATMKDRTDLTSFIQAFAGSNRFILDYLVEEVLQSQPEPVQDFLLKTSILARMCSSLCDAVLGDRGIGVKGGGDEGIEEEGIGDRGEDIHAIKEAFDLSEDLPFSTSQEILEHLEKSNLFVIPLDDQREWYRYHRLFADILQKRLTQYQADLIAGLHRRASEWFTQNGWVSEAIDHALCAGDFDEAVSLIERSADAVLLRGEITTLLGWLEQLPNDRIQSMPYIELVSAAGQVFSGYSQEIIYPLLDQVERDCAQYADEILVLHAYLAIYEMDYQRAENLTRDALERMSREPSFFRSAGEWVLSICQVNDDDYQRRAKVLEGLVRKGQSMGSQWFTIGSLSRLADVRMHLGQIYEARDLYKQALALGTRRDGSMLPVSGVAMIGLGQISMEWYELKDAAHYIEQGIALNQMWHPFAVLEGLLSLAKCEYLQGDVEGAREALQRARQVAVDFDVTEIDDRVVALTEADIKLSQGDHQAVSRYLDELSKASPIPSQFDRRIRKYEQIASAKAYLAQDQPGMALGVIEDLQSDFEKNNRTMLLIEIGIMRSLALQELGEVDTAQAEFERTLRLAEPGGYVRLFVEAGPALSRFLKNAVNKGVCPDYAARILEILKSGMNGEDQDAGHDQTGLVEPLSDRELQVLRYLNSSLTIPEIAVELYISDSTVRSHVKNIYGKLGVHRRMDAIKRSEELGLLTGPVE